MAVTNIQAWVMGAFGSLVGGMVSAYYLGDQNTRDKILFVTPFIVIGTIGTFKALSSIPEDAILKKIQEETRVI